MFELIDLIIVRPITNILFIIYGVVGDFGLAIILFTLLVKFCVWPLTKSQLNQTKAMRKMQPELAEIKKCCNGNKQLESLQMMELYKKHNIKPFRSILTILIQLPIFIALYTAIRVMVTPTIQDNLNQRAYTFTHNLPQISEVITAQESYLAEVSNGNTEATYNFHPKLFGLVELDARANFTSVSSVIILIFVLLAAAIQYFVMKQQQPKVKNKKSFKQIMKEAADGKEPDQTEINAAVSGQTAAIMPLMMAFIMLQLPGALVFYYLLTYLIQAGQQKYIFHKDLDEMDALADKSVVRELNKIQEAEVIENKKTGTKITHFSAKNNKKRRKK